MDLGSDGAGEKTEIRSDVRQNDVRLKKPDPGSGPLRRADGRQPFMPASVSRFLPLSLPFGIAS